MASTGRTTPWPPSTSRPCCASSSSPLDALGDGPRGDRRPQRLPGARRRHRHQHVPDRRGRPRRAARRGRHRATPRTADLRTALAAFARGALLGARGNSGVILSPAASARCCKRLAAAGPERPLRARCSPTAWRWPPRPATPRSARRSRAPSSPSPGPRPRRAAACRGRPGAPARRTCSAAAAAGRPGGAGPHARAAAGAARRRGGRRRRPRAVRGPRRRRDRADRPPPGRPAPHDARRPDAIPVAAARRAT